MTNTTQKSIRKTDPWINFMQDRKVAISSTLKLLYLVFLGASIVHLLPPNTGKGIVFLIATLIYKFLIDLIIEAISLPPTTEYPKKI